jgi:hypothetical protein
MMASSGDCAWLLSLSIPTDTAVQWLREWPTYCEPPGHDKHGAVPPWRPLPDPGPGPGAKTPRLHLLFLSPCRLMNGVHFKSVPLTAPQFSPLTALEPTRLRTLFPPRPRATPMSAMRELSSKMCCQVDRIDHGGMRLLNDD